ncbi:hypothetical protein D3C78_808660 [compost metagenome]
MQVDQVADVLHRADLALLAKAATQRLAGHIGTHHQDETGAVEQAAVGKHANVDAIGLFDDGNGHRLAVDQRRQGLAQGGHHWREGRRQVVVLIHREAVRATAIAGEGGELASQGHQLAVQPLGVQRAQLVEVFDQRLGAVDQLQQHEVGNLRRPAIGRGDHSARQRFATLVQQAQQLAAKAGQLLAGRHVEYRRDVAVIHHQRAVGALFADAQHAEGGVVAQAVLAAQQAQGAAAEGQRRTVFERRVVVAHLADTADIAGASDGFALVDGVAGPRPLEWQPQVDNAIAQIVGHFQRRRWQVVAGDVERRAVGQQAAGAENRHLALGKQALVEQQLGETPRGHAQRPVAGVDEVFEVAIMLLEMLGRDEHAFRPHHAIVPGHGDSDCLAGRFRL